MIEFANPWALYAFAVLIPVIILYMLRPKPKELHVPSLMFIVGMEQRRHFRSFLRKIIRDPLLILQIIALSLLVLAIADPFYTTMEVKRINENVVIVMDISASMQAGNPTRFEQAKENARSIVDDLGEGDKISIVLAENIPYVALKEGTKLEANSIIENLFPKATPTGIGGAILLGADLIKDSTVEKKIYVLSDFSSYEGIDPRAAQKTAFANSISVSFIKVGSAGDNVGIISLRSGRSQIGCFIEILVKNYASENKTIVANLMLDGQNVDSLEKVVKPGSAEVFPLSSQCSGLEHDAVASLSLKDALSVDNTAYAIIPAIIETDILLIRERDSELYVKYALESLPGVNLDESYPPIYPNDYSGYDVVVFQNAKSQNVLAGTFPTLKRFVERGGKLVILGFEGLMDVPPAEINGILPITPISMSSYEGNPSRLFDHQILKDVEIEDVLLKKYVYADPNNGTITLADISGSSIIAIADVGMGKVVYVGIYPNGNWSDFHLKPSFPVFWNNLLAWFNKDKSIGESNNFKTGDRMPLGVNQSARVKTPSGEIIEGTDIILDEVGFYSIEGSSFRGAASLQNEEESDVSYTIDVGSADVSEGYKKENVEEKTKKELFIFLAVAALVMIAIEWFYYKGRGSL